MGLQSLTNWIARRSGAALTIKGTDEAGAEQRITASTVESRNGEVVATLPNGTQVLLRP